MASTPIYNWPTPDNTGLVKNGALDMRTLGNAIDTTMATMTPKSLVDAKGDLIAASANDTPARLAVGNNGETLVADSSTSTGLRYQGSFASGKNRLINGAMTVYQRGGFSGSLSGGTAQYGGPDRWFMGVGSGTTTVSCTQVSASLTGFDKALRAQRASGQTATGAIYVVQQVETANLIPLQNQTITISFWARAGANFSSASSALNVFSATGTGTDQAAWGGLNGAWTGWANQLSSNVTLTTSWQKFSASFTMPSTATEANFGFNYTPSGTASTNDYFDVTGVQVEIGSVATGFTPSSGTIQGELSACQRYYYRATPANSYHSFGSAFSNSTTTMLGAVVFPVTMRIAPTALEQRGTASEYGIQQGGTGITCSAVPSFSNGTTYNSVVTFTVASGLTAGSAGLLRNENNVTAYLAWSAEL